MSVINYIKIIINQLYTKLIIIKISNWNCMLGLKKLEVGLMRKTTSVYSNGKRYNNNAQNILNSLMQKKIVLNNQVKSRHARYYLITI